MRDSQIARLVSLTIYCIFPFLRDSWDSRDSHWYFREKRVSFSTKFSREKLRNETRCQPYILYKQWRHVHSNYVKTTFAHIFCPLEYDRRDWPTRLSKNGFCDKTDWSFDSYPKSELEMAQIWLDIWFWRWSGALCSESPHGVEFFFNREQIYILNGSPHSSTNYYNYYTD
jgi:hypothetical protein